MASKNNSLEEFRKRKALLKNEVSELESIITFNDTKESLSAITNGLSDNYLVNKKGSNGESKLGINSGAVMKNISNRVTKKAASKDAILNFTENAISGGAMDDVIRLGVVAMVGSFAKKKINDTSWKNKIIGAALIYLLPIGLKYARKKLEEYQRNKSISSMGKII